MTAATYAEARQNMVDNQLRANKVVDERLIEVMGRLPRERFVPEHLRGIAYIDEDLPLGNGRFLIEPMVLARLIQTAAPQPGEKALDIGCGSGYSSAVLAALTGTVVGIEQDAVLADLARTALAREGVANASILTAPFETGHVAGGPYDVVLIGGGIERLPPTIVSQMAPSGRLVTVMRRRNRVGEAILYRRSPAAELPLFDAAPPLLPGFAAEPSFVF